jgi:hypothetical protein
MTHLRHAFPGPRAAAAPGAEHITIQHTPLAFSQAELSLFGTCPIPACKNLVNDPREPCRECLEAFGPLLRQADGPAPDPDAYTAEIAQRDADVRALLAERRDMVPLPDPPAPAEPAWKRNQLCWLCEQRRTCHPDPDHPDRWICRECEALP